QLKAGGNRLMPSDFSAELASQTNVNISNPYRSAILGYFNFLLVPNNYYRLEAVKGDYVMMNKVDASKIPANASRIYFDKGTGRTAFFFQDSDAFYQGTQLLRYDIPMMPKNGSGLFYGMEMLTKNKSQSQDGKYIIYEGQVSHPFAKLTVQTCSEDPKVCNNPQVFTSQNGGPDEFGNFRIQLDQTLLQPGQRYEPTFEKVNLASATITKREDIFDKILSWMHKTILREVQAQEAGATLTDSAIQPIVSYIEGFAYDIDGNLMPNATVGIYVDLMNKPTYTTKTNENGYYKITSENIPNGEYVLKYISTDNPQHTATITTSQFTKQNEDFIKVEEINTYSLVTKTTDPRRTITPTYVPPAKISAVPNEFPVTPTIPPAPLTPVEEATNNNIFLIGAVLLILVATAGSLIGVYLYKKRMQDQPL
ncbi:MAG TPA: carboxypeptidase-like regulatory domain-containing protein, partial [Candidatus Woesebacteria bacterium]|nr:carboxypeptidase-like regulatory domain-containing protein [Candidatus Woesebacteria bacterium]